MKSDIHLNLMRPRCLVIHIGEKMSDAYYLICDETREFADVVDGFGAAYASFMERASGSQLRLDTTPPPGYQLAELEDDGLENLQEICSRLDMSLTIFFAAFSGSVPLTKEQKSRAIQNLRDVHKQTTDYLKKEGGYVRFDVMDFFYPDD